MSKLKHLIILSSDIYNNNPVLITIITPAKCGHAIQLFYYIFHGFPSPQRPAGFVVPTQDPGVKFDVEILPLSCSQDFYDLSILTLMGINSNYIFFLSESLVVVF